MLWRDEEAQVGSLNFSRILDLIRGIRDRGTLKNVKLQVNDEQHVPCHFGKEQSAKPDRWRKREMDMAMKSNKHTMAKLHF